MGLECEGRFGSWSKGSESNEGCSECIEGKIRVKGTVQCIERWLIDYSKERGRANLLNTKGSPGL